MKHFWCPECGAETRLEPAFGREIVSVYCLRHTGGADGHVRPVCMTMGITPIEQLVESKRTPLAA